MSRRVKKKRPSKKEESSNVDDSINTGFYDHLRPKASGTTEVSVSRRGPNSLLAVSLIVIIFVGLVLFGAFTNDINFGGNNNGPSSIDNINNDIDRNVFDIADVCSTPDQHDNGDGTLFSYGFNLYMISLAGGQYEIPSGVGYILDEDGEECYMGMHIDGGENFVHVLFGTSYNGLLPTIQDFFGIWSKELSATTLFNETGVVKGEVDGELLGIYVGDYQIAQTHTEDVIISILP